MENLSDSERAESLAVLRCPKKACNLKGPHVCLELPFDDDRDVTPAEKQWEESTYLHGN